VVPGKRYAVFAIRTTKNGSTVWIRAGVAYVQADDSMNLTLDVLPIDGQLHIREAGQKQSQLSMTNNNSRREEPAVAPVVAPPSMGGH
jgi:hypothetical protein